MVVLRRVMRLVLQQAHKQMSVEDVARVGDAQLFVLHVLSHDGQMTAGDLATRCHVADPTMSKTLNHLEANGLITRQIDPTNRRVVKVTLTKEGGAILNHVETEMLRSLSQVLSPLTEAQLRDLIVAMGHLESLVGSDEGEHAASPSEHPARNGAK
jgi:DNA-binding MarR family transcriptional regulator